MRIEKNAEGHFNSTNFARDHLKGSIGLAIVQTYLVSSGYEIYPFGYENRFANVTRFVRKSDSDPTMRKLRAMPDLLLYDREDNETLLVEVKSSSVKRESEYLIPRQHLDAYKAFWPESILVVYCIYTTNIYCRVAKDIRPRDLREERSAKTPIEFYVLRLGDFLPMPECFRRVKPHPYKLVQRDVDAVLKEYAEAATLRSK